MNIWKLANAMHISAPRYSAALREGALERPKNGLTPEYVAHVHEVMGTWGKKPKARKRDIAKIMSDCPNGKGEKRGAYYVKRLEDLAET